MKLKKKKFLKIHITAFVIILGIGIGLADFSARKPEVKGIMQTAIPDIVSSPTPVIDVTLMSFPKYRLPILMYHYVEKVMDKQDTIRQKMAVSPEVFEYQIGSLVKAGYISHFASEIPDIISGKTRYNPKMIFLTFDDGYEDFYTVAYPILKKYQVKSTQFIIYNFIGRPNYMNENQIRDLIRDDLVEIASHTLNHVDLKRVSSESASYEIVESRKKLSETFGIPVRSFSYPYGSFSSFAVELTRQGGYDLAVSVISSVKQSKGNLFYLSRIRPEVLGMGDISKNLEEYRK